MVSASPWGRPTLLFPAAQVKTDIDYFVRLLVFLPNGSLFSFFSILLLLLLLHTLSLIPHPLLMTLSTSSSTHTFPIRTHTTPTHTPTCGTKGHRALPNKRPNEQMDLIDQVLSFFKTCTILHTPTHLLAFPLYS